MTVGNKRQPNGLPEYYCHRGNDIKDAIVRDFIIQPVAHLKLITGQTKTSYSGYPLTDQTIVFHLKNALMKIVQGLFSVVEMLQRISFGVSVVQSCRYLIL